MAKEFEKLNVPKDAKLIDLAAGTGALGKELKALGYSCIDALDGTKGMLEVAKKKNIYRNLFQFFLGCEDKSPISEGISIVLLKLEETGDKERHKVISIVLLELEQIDERKAS
ncbi:methyltransferase-like protein 27 [Tachypleus tridentatus]|uniref:methyltransferase-like protein 27 n=1 Tax=Tachypleus tridentatus TaxID=6853 RepID=UPI003FD21A02